MIKHLVLSIVLLFAANAANPLDLHLFFERQNDGMAFIRHWSHHKNPVSYLQYFKDIRKELDFKTGKLKRVER